MTETNTAAIVADTSKYLYGSADRLLAAAECIKAQRAGKQIQAANRGKNDWEGDEDGFEFCCLDTLDYRVKPEPVVTTKGRYRLYVPMGGTAIRSAHNLVNTYDTRWEALESAYCYSGSVLIDAVEVTFVDGVETSERVCYP